MPFHLMRDTVTGFASYATKSRRQINAIMYLARITSFGYAPSEARNCLQGRSSAQRIIPCKTALAKCSAELPVTKFLGEEIRFLYANGRQSTPTSRIGSTDSHQDEIRESLILLIQCWTYGDRPNAREITYRRNTLLLANSRTSSYCSDIPHSGHPIWFHILLLNCV